MTEIPKISGVGFETTLGAVRKLDDYGVLRRTRNVGRATVYRFDSDSRRSKALESLAFRIADGRAEWQAAHPAG